MSKPAAETITAIATPPGKGGVAIIRISGPLVKYIAECIIKKSIKPRVATLCSFYDENNTVLDKGIAIFFPKPHSFTGDDVLELQGHGGPVVADMLLKTVLCHGARFAQAGEFSKRAYLNGKLDLTQAEAIADLIEASSEQAARSALRSLQGDFAKKINNLVEAIINIRLYIESAIDFVEEEIDFLADQAIIKKLNNLIYSLAEIENSAIQGSLLREGIHVVIAGKPNVGKSSLLNQLSGVDTAIVSDIAGTTRDVLRASISLKGIPLHLIDTAGLRESVDSLEQEGIRRAKLELKSANFVLYVVDASQTESDTVDAIDILPEIPRTLPIVIVRNKLDLTQELPTSKLINNMHIISLSAKTGHGCELLTACIEKIAGFDANSSGVFCARRRHLDALARAKKHIASGLVQVKNYEATELLAEDLRQAQQALSEIIGDFSTDDLLGRIFSNFCIGK